MASAKELLERLTIREIVENWALLRDARRWDRFRELWHEEGRMITTWIEGSFEEFIKASQAGYDKGVRFLHFLGGTTIDLKRNRAIAQTKQTISYRSHDRRRAVRRGLHWTLLFLPGETQRPLGHRAVPADPREGSPRSR